MFLIIFYMLGQQIPSWLATLVAFKASLTSEVCYRLAIEFEKKLNTRELDVHDDEDIMC